MLSCVFLTGCRFDEKIQSMEPDFPKKIADDFPGVDSKVDAAFEAFGKRILAPLATGHSVSEGRGQLD